MATPRLPFQGAALGAALLLVAGPASAATGDTTARGTAATTSVPLHVEALNLPADLGRTTLMATTDGDTTSLAPWSTVQLTLANIGGARFGDVAVESDGTTTSSGLDVTRSTVFGDVGASTGNLLALADETAGTANAALTTLTADATVLNGLGVSATITDVLASVDDTGAAATHSLAVAGVDLDLAHILGTVLHTLPLQDLLAIATELGVDVPVDLSSAGAIVTATEDLLVAVAAAAEAAGDVETAAADLLAADGGTLAELQSLLAQAGALDPVGDPAGTIIALTGLINDPTVPDACADLDLDLDVLSIEDDVTAAIACLEAEIEAHLGTLSGELDALAGAVTDYLDAVAAATDAAAILSGSSSLEDIVGQIEDLLAGLLAADLFAIGPIEVTQQVRAIGGDVDASSASHTCRVTTITTVGVEPVDVADCNGASDTLTAIVDTITAVLGTVLDTVGGVDAGDGVSLELFGTVEDAVSEDDDGYVRATSVMEVLALTIPDITITPCDIETVGALVCALGLDLTGPLGDALTAVDGVLELAHATVTGALATVTDILAAAGLDLDVSDADEAQVLVDAAIGTLQGVLDGLNLGELGTGGGATVPGARIVVDPKLEAEHTLLAASGDPGPADPAPGDPSDDPSLPNTGGGAALVAILAIAAGAWLWRRREAE